MKKTIYMRCPVCDNIHYVEVDEEKYSKWKNGEEVIQKIMPEKNATEREQLISGVCPICQQYFFNMIK